MKFNIINHIFKKERKEKEIIPSQFFQSSTDIDQPNILFGRKQILQDLCGYADGLHQVQIIGARRFGKTCLAKSFVTQEKTNQNRNVYPVFVDLYHDEINGTANVYRYLSAQIIANLYNDDYLSDTTFKVDDYINIAPNANWKRIFKQLRNIEDIEAEDYFDETLKKTKEKTGQTILLIFDEYEKSTDAFDNVHGFRHLRKLSDKTPYLKFWIVGAIPWDKFILGDDKDDYRASKVFNGIQFDIYVCPLVFDDFQEMWNYECSQIPDVTKRQSLNLLCEEVYVSSGGVPCFAKEIGTHIYVKGMYPKYDCISKHFPEIVKTLSDEEIRCLRELLFAPKEYDPLMIPNSVTVLENYGLIIKDEQNKYNISIRFFADYLHAKLLDEQIESSDSLDVDTIVNKIEDLFYNINEKWKDLYDGKYMFDTVNDTQKCFRALRLICDSREKVPNFINSIYLLYWEGSKENKNGEKIPDPFRWTMFRKSMDKLRHILGKAHQQDKLETAYGQIDKQSALEYVWGKRTEPQSPLDCQQFQKCMLNSFLQELNNLYNYIEKEYTIETIDPSLSEIITKFASGTYRKGEFGRKDVIEQDSGYRHEVRSIRNGEIIDDGEIVEYTLNREPNRNPTKEWFYFAEDVHLKN